MNSTKNDVFPRSGKLTVRVNSLETSRLTLRFSKDEANFAKKPHASRSSSRPSEARAGIAKRLALQSVTIPDKALPFRDDGDASVGARGKLRLEAVCLGATAKMLWDCGRSGPS
jgi:hypothetical protein